MRNIFIIIMKMGRFKLGIKQCLMYDLINSFYTIKYMQAREKAWEIKPVLLKLEDMCRCLKSQVRVVTHLQSNIHHALFIQFWEPGVWPQTHDTSTLPTKANPQPICLLCKQLT